MNTTDPLRDKLLQILPPEQAQPLADLFDETEAALLLRIRAEGRMCAADVCRHCAAGVEFKLVRYSDTLVQLEHPGPPSYPDVGPRCAAEPIHFRWIVLRKLEEVMDPMQALVWFDAPQPRLDGRTPRSLVADQHALPVVKLADAIRLGEVTP